MRRSTAQLSFDLLDEAPASVAQATAGAFTSNLKLPVHRWFRYSAGFSADWAASVIAEHGGPAVRLLDPFLGSGTTLVEAQRLGATGFGFEPHAFVARIARAKLSWRHDPRGFQHACNELLARARIRSAVNTGPLTAPLLVRCFSPDALDQLSRLKSTFIATEFADPQSAAQIALALTSILRECSHAGTAQWQYILPNKNKSRVAEPFDAFAKRSGEMYADMIGVAARSAASVLIHDARMKHPEVSEIDLVITSPPYPNNYDYADATRFEMTFWGEVENWSDLHQTVRRNLITSCSQHASAERLVLEDLLGARELGAIAEPLAAVCRELAEVRETKGGKKAYHTMLAAYFRDLAQVWIALRQQVREGGRVYFVIGDSAPYGVYAPVDEWLGALALSAGFKQWRFVKWRDRNTKWKNRKHQVPLKEGLLIVDG